MKYISVVVLIVVMSWTWCLATTERPIRLEQHKHVEAGVEEDIRGFIQRRFPTVTEIFCPQLYTEEGSNPEEMVARFRCQANAATGSEDATEQIFEGFLRLRSADEFDTWSEVGGEIKSKEIRFLNEIKITPRSSDEK